MRIFYSPNETSKITLNSNDTWKITTPPFESPLFTLWYFKNSLKTRMIPRKRPPLRMTDLYSPYYIWQVTSKPERYLENYLPSKWQPYSPYYIWKITSKPEWYLENNLPSKWQPYSPYYISNITSKPEWYLENYQPPEWHLTIHLMKFEKYPQNPNDT